MKRVLPFLLPALLLLSCGDEQNPAAHVAFDWNVPATPFDFARYVDPIIGTAGHGHTFPGATAPFGMVQLSPDTRVDGSWDGCSGYHYDDSLIYGFSHTHLSGTGCSDYGDILLMPGTGEVQYTNGADGKPGYRSSFSHKNETAAAGYYSVVLDNSKTKVELTASPRVGMHKYNFPGEKDEWILLDLQHRDEVLATHLEIVDDHTIRGYRFSKAWATDQRVWFYAEFSEGFSKHTLWSGNKTFEADSSSAKDLKAAFSFDVDGHTPVLVKLALSPVSWENAQLNMQTEVPDWDFDAVRKKVTRQWNYELSKIEVKDNDERKKKIFYTALYHCCVAPNIYCDVNGEYRGRDQQVHRDTLHPQYTVFSLWDTYRALHPLFTIIQPKRDQDFIRTFLKQYKEGGRLPVWELSANETDCMIGYHSVSVIVDAWMKGLTDFDTALAYEAMKAGAMSDERGLKAYKQCGFIPAEGESESVSKTLEYAYDDWCIAQAAKRMKRDDDYRYFMRRSQNWRNLFNRLSETKNGMDGFFRPRLNNSHVNPFDPSEVNFHFTEANAWQYSLAAPQNLDGMIAAYGGYQKFGKHLDGLFSVSSETSGRQQADITGLVGQYAQGNEPSHHMAYLYDFIGQPWETQKLVSKICNELYTDQPNGLCGNEDCGQMSAWYVFSSIGFYPVTPGNPVFALGSPQFAEVILHLENGKSFSVNAKNAGPDNPYATNRFGFGLEQGDWRVLYSSIMKGGSEQFEMSAKPEIFFDAYSALSVINDSLAYFPTVPYVDIAHDQANGSPKFEQLRTFRSTMEVLIDNDGNSTTYLSINGGPYEVAPPLVKTPSLLRVSETSTIRTFAKNKDGLCSDTATFSYLKIPAGRSIKLNTTYKNQYAAGGDNALIDGIRGADNFRTGDWQGYEGNNVEAIVDLGSKKEISKVSIGFLQDQGAWIFMPEAVTFYVSDDGVNFTELGAEQDPIGPQHNGAILHDFTVQKTMTARYVKVVAKNRGKCPDWHPGKGSPCWIFADEIVIETKEK